MSEVVSAFGIKIEQVSGYEFRVTFDKPQHPSLLMDEPEPLGKDSAPNPSRILAAAIGDCLSASLMFCLSRSGANVSDLKTEVSVELVRNEQKRLRNGDSAFLGRTARNSDRPRPAPRYRSPARNWGRSAPKSSLASGAEIPNSAAASKPSDAPPGTTVLLSRSC